MRKSRISPISDKRKELLAREVEEAQRMTVECGGKCMICGRKARLEKNHTRDRKRFVMSCRECHFPSNQHRYLDDWKLNELKGCYIIVKEV